MDKSRVFETDYTQDPIYTRAVDDTRHKIMDDLQDLINIQCANGNWNYDPYMMGLANGLIIAESIISHKEPKFLSKPKKWLKDYPSLWTKFRWWLRGGAPVSSALDPNKKEQ